MSKLKLAALAAVSTLAISGCASTSPSNVVMNPSTGEQAPPAEYAKFHSILDASKLQISEPNAKPGSKGEMATDSNFTGIVNDNFYVDRGSEAFVFKMEGYKLRNELRVLENFKTDDYSKFYRLSADIMPINPQASISGSDPKRDEMTFLQVHNKGTFDDGLHGVGYIPHPLLRVVWEGERRGVNNHYWAVIKNNAVNCGKDSGNRETQDCKKAYKRYDLGPLNEERPTRFDIIVGDQTLYIKVDGDIVVRHPIGYWQDMLSYFKAGVYNQFENGQSEAHFYNLEYAMEEFSPDD